MNACGLIVAQGSLSSISERDIGCMDLPRYGTTRNGRIGSTKPEQAGCQRARFVINIRARGVYREWAAGLQAASALQSAVTSMGQGRSTFDGRRRPGPSARALYAMQGLLGAPRLSVRAGPSLTPALVSSDDTLARLFLDGTIGVCLRSNSVWRSGERNCHGMPSHSLSPQVAR